MKYGIDTIHFDLENCKSMVSPAANYHMQLWKTARFVGWFYQMVPWFPVIFPWIFHPKPPFFLLKGTWVSSRQCPVPEPTSWWLILTPNKKITHQLGPSLLDQETNRWNHQNLIDPPNWMANFPLKIGQDPLVVHLWATFFSGKRQTWYTGILPWRWTNI